MRKQLFSVIGTLCFLAIILTASVHAQSPETTLHAKIPFAFTIRGKTLPAGEYTVSRIGDAPDGLLIQGVDNRANVMFETIPVEARAIPNKCELVFHRYGDQYFLEEIFTPGESEGRELLESRAERAVRREMNSTAAKTTAAETVALVTVEQ